MKRILAVIALITSTLSGFSQVDSSFIYNTSMPYGTLDIRLRKSATRFYYLQEGKTFSYRESAPGVKSDTYRDMTSFDSSPFTQGNLREKNGSADYFILNYRLLLPQNYQADYDPGYPIIIMTHGLGERGNCWGTSCYHATASWNPNVNSPLAPTSNDHRLLNNDHNLLHGGKQHLDARNLAGSRLPDDPNMPGRAFPGFVLFPQNLNGWSAATCQDVIRLIRLVSKQYNVDPDRIYIHGLSNGGSASYEIIKRAPWLFAAALPMSAPSDASIGAQGMTSRIAHIPMWIFQGGTDTAPTPAKTEGYVKRWKDNGMSVRYTKYMNLGHGVWNTAYAEPDFFQFILAQNKSRVQVFADATAICLTNGRGVRLRLAEGFRKYEWTRDGIVIPEATGANYEAMIPGVYRARFSRVLNPTEADWNQWSQEITVTEKNPAQAQTGQIGTLLLKGLDNYGNGRLFSVEKADIYYWYKNGVRVALSDTVRYPLFKPGDCTSGVCTGNGNYTLVTAGFDGCPSPESEPKKIWFNNNGPINITAPTNFAGTVVSPTTANLSWVDNSAEENGFEIWRRTRSGVAPSYIYGTWVLAGIAGADATSFVDSRLVPGTYYQLKIRAVGTNGRSNYTPLASTAYLVLTTTPDAENPSVPQNLVVEQTGIGRLKLNWDASTDNTGIKQYAIKYGDVTINTPNATPSYTISGLAINQNLSFTVTAVDLGNNLSGPSTATPGSTYVEGLYYEHTTGAWSTLDAINWNTFEYSGKTDNFGLGLRTQEDYFNFKFDGYLYISTGGSYTFSTVSSDGSRVEIDGVRVVNNDGIHSSVTSTGSSITLTSGPKRILVKYFEYEENQNLTVRYRGPDTGNSTIAIPADRLRSSPGVGGASVGDVQVVSADELQAEERIAIYPNPSPLNELKIKIEDGEDKPVRVRIVDFNGRPRYDKEFSYTSVREGVSLESKETMPNGLYLMVVEEGNKTTKKLVIIRN
jgi:hypothetical protein